jgi:3,4-dihydroxy 2-butanone 4-phosphate synthase
MNAPLDLLALRIDAALAALRAGRPVIVSDDADREDEADLILAADTLSVTEMARMIRDGSGIVCLCLTAEHAARLELPLMVAENRSRHGTAFTVSIQPPNPIMPRMATTLMMANQNSISPNIFTVYLPKFIFIPDVL